MGQVHAEATGFGGIANGDGDIDGDVGFDEDGDEDEDEEEDEDDGEDGGRRRIEVSGDGAPWSIPRRAVPERTPSGSASNRFKQPVLQK
jgi:hypothetical protein